MAQDIHFSDYLHSPLNLSPSQAGDFAGSYRFSGIYRWQYGTVSTPFQTIGLGIDTRSRRRRRRSTPTPGIGLQVNYDKAGSSRLSLLQIGIPIALHIPMDRGKTTLSPGVMPSMASRSLSTSGLQFPDQYVIDNPGGYVASQEDIASPDFTYFDIAVGLGIKHQITRKISAKAGFSAFNILRPAQDFTGTDNTRLPIRNCIHSSVSIRAASMLDIVPNGKFQFQSTQQEYQFGCLAVHYFDNVSIPMMSYGMWFRSRSSDAIVLNAGVVYEDFSIGFSYDINISSLSTASNTVGAFEVSLIYIYNRSNIGKRYKSIKCPSHI